MAKPYRRRKGKNFVGAFRVTIDGRDINLQTKDANEAHRRAALAAKGKWPVVDAAANAARAVLDPKEDHETPGPADLPGALGGGGPQTVEPAVHLPPPPAVITPGAPPAPAESLADAAAAAAAEVSGAAEGERVEAAQITREAEVESKLAGLMAKLSGEAGTTDLAGGVCKMAADLLLAAEKKTIEWGGTWALRRRGGNKTSNVVAGDPPELMREALAVGLQGYALIHFPDFAQRLTPGWAVAIGMIGGAGAMVVGASIVKRDADGKVTETAPVVPVPNSEASAPPPA